MVQPEEDYENQSTAAHAAQPPPGVNSGGDFGWIICCGRRPNAAAGMAEEAPRLEDGDAQMPRKKRKGKQKRNQEPVTGVAVKKSMPPVKAALPKETPFADIALLLPLA